MNRQRGFLTEKAIVWLVVIAGCLALWAAAVATYHHVKDAYDERRREEGRVEIRTAWTAAVVKGTQILADDRARKDKSQKEADDALSAALDRAIADAAAARTAGDRLRTQLAAFLAARRDGPQAPAAPDGRPRIEGLDPLDLLADLFSRADDAAGELALYADQLHAAGVSCERRYEIEVTP